MQTQHLFDRLQEAPPWTAAFQQKGRTGPDTVDVWFLWIEVKVVAMTMAKPHGLLCSICCHDNHLFVCVVWVAQPEKKKCWISYNKRHHYDTALNRKQILGLQETGWDDYFYSFRFYQYACLFFLASVTNATMQIKNLSFGELKQDLGLVTDKEKRVEAQRKTAGTDRKKKREMPWQDEWK